MFPVTPIINPTVTGYRVISYAPNRAMATRRANQFLASLDPYTDECPEMMIEVARDIH